ncbi:MULTISPECIES: SymE family type I addiction module toxin [unclassified Leclercia]|uniref:SymE family type I addiction module toxin n=1 Tax=unclassified Leclercia TaxID=2627398 RepID=UPI000DF4AF02|nr:MULTISPECIES: SymE family type I addiction module toxin [unclassified Leclercia]AXF61218.1 type I addiction module toxin, SymE family [Leclercia sp. W6]AXF62704.1 type I addiction module toxin, SymE family [Leclercia sp. W17]
MADSHSTSDTAATGTERTLIVGYRPQGLDRSTPNLILSGKWLRAAGFDTGDKVTVKVMDGCIVVMAHNPHEKKLLDELKQAQHKLKGIESALAVS